MMMTDCNDKPSTRIWNLQRMQEISDAEFRQWQELIEARTGMTLTPERRSFLQANLGIRMREVGCKTYGEYYERVIGGSGAVVEWSILVDRLTVQETRFFRDPDAMAMVASHIRELGPDRVSRRPVSVWSVGCATGEEAYSLAITVRNALTEIEARPRYDVTATDISLPALEKARAGVFNARKLADMDDDVRNSSFIHREDSRYEVIKSLRDHLCFSRVNILELEKTPMHGMDIIFCQNVLIYFRRSRREEILNALADRLAEGGILVIGQGEITGWQHPNLEKIRSGKVLAYARRSEQQTRSGYGQQP